MIKNIVTIPTRFDTSFIPNIYEALKNEVDEWLIYDNGLDDLEYEKIADLPIHIIDAYGDSIYQMWNRAWKIARTYYQFSNLFVLNDDVDLLPQTFNALATILRSNAELAAICPNYNKPLKDGIGNSNIEYVTITHGQNGLAGFAFMLKAELEIPYVDENFQLWYGDDDLVKKIHIAGYKAAKAMDIPIAHHGAKSISKLDQTKVKTMIELDRVYFNNKYNERRTI